MIKNLAAAMAITSAADAVAIKMDYSDIELTGVEPSAQSIQPALDYSTVNIMDLISMDDAVDYSAQPIVPTPPSPPVLDNSHKDISIDYSEQLIPQLVQPVQALPAGIPPPPGLDYMANSISLPPGFDEDALTQPMFVSGGEADLMDYGGPIDNCCRIYSLKDFKGVYYDVCVFKSGVATEYDLKMIGW